MLTAVAALALFVSACGASPAADRDASPPPERERAGAVLVEIDSPTYAAQAVELLAELARASELIASVMERADIDSDSWRVEATSMLADLRALHGRASELQADAVAEPVQAHLVAATAEYDRAAGLLVQAIESLDLAKASDAAGALSEAVFALADVRLLLEELQRG